MTGQKAPSAKRRIKTLHVHVERVAEFDLSESTERQTVH